MSTSPSTESRSKPRPVKSRPAGVPQLREALFDDFERIATLQVRNGLPCKSLAEWTALWTRNPAWHHAGKPSIGLVLETAERELVGYVASIPAMFHFRGRRLRAAVTGSWVIDPRFRAYSMQMLNRITRQDHVDLLITDTVSARAEPALRMFQWRRVPSGAWDRSFFWITGFRGFAAAALQAKAVPPHRLLAWPAALALACRDGLRRRLPSHPQEPFAVESCDRFDPRFAAIWADLLARRQDVLTADRSTEALEWHFGAQLADGRAWVVLLSLRGKPVAYAVFDRHDSPRLGLKRVRLIDFQALESPAAALGSVLAWMRRRCRAEGIHILESAGSLLRPLGPPETVAPHSRTLDAWRYYYKATNDLLDQALQDAAAWDPSPYDGDTCL